MDSRISQLDDRAVLRVLSEVTQNLREELPEKELKRVSTTEEARAAVAALITAGGGRQINPDSIVIEGPAAVQAARGILQALWNDPAHRAAVEPALTSPPADAQKSPELAVAGAVILGALISWLQTTIDIEVNRKDGKLDFAFKLRKEPAANNVISATAKTVSHLIGL
jgi:hypothetical protein